MKSLLCAAALLLPLVVWQEKRERQEKKEHDTELGRTMERLEDQAKVLRRSLREKATPAALAALAEIESLTLQCKVLEPEAGAKLPDAERASFVTTYRRTMVDFLTRQLEIEAALLDGDEAAAQAAFDRFREMEDSSHDRFAPEDD